MVFQIRRTLTAFSLVGLAFGAATGCGGQGTETTCTTSACTVTFDRGVDAEASILGIKVQLVGVKGDRVTLTVAGQRVTVPVGGESQADGVNVAVQEVTEDKVVVRVSTGGGG